jgi:ubiquinone biosynthesis protein
MRGEVESLLISIINKDAIELTDSVMRLGSVPPELDRDALRTEISNFVSEYGSRSLRDFNLSAALKQMTDIIRRYHILLPSTLAMMLKMLVMLEGTSRTLNPNFNLAELIEPYQVKVLKNRFSLDRVLRKIYRAYRDWDRLFDMFPRDVVEVLRRIRNGTFETRHSHGRLETTIHRLGLAMMTSAFFLGSSQMLAHKVPPAPGDLSIVGTLGLVMSMYFAYRLLRVIGKDEDSEKKK